MNSEGAIETFEIDSNDSYFMEARGVHGVTLEDFQDRFRAVAVDPATHTPVGAVSRYQVEGRPLLWFVPEFQEVVVDAAAFGELTTQRAYLAEAGRREPVGTCQPAALKGLKPRQLVRFLLEANVVRCFAHLKADLALREEQESDAVYQARFEGVHVFMTNEENREAYSFVIELNKETGAVVLRGS